MSCRCQRSSVSGVATVAISRKAARSHPVRSRSQPSAIIVGETQAPGPKLAPQEPVLFDQARAGPSQAPRLLEAPVPDVAQHHVIDHVNPHQHTGRRQPAGQLHVLWTRHGIA